MKTACIYHSIDLDGYMSAAIVKHWFIENHPEGSINNKLIKEESFKFEDANIDFIGYNYGQPIPDLSEYDQVIMSDISFPKEYMEVLFTKLQNNFIWCDHHISAIKDSEIMFYHKAKGLRDTKFAACELTWVYFFSNESMPEIVRLLGRYDCFGHKGTDEETKVLEFQYGTRQCISNYEEAYNALKQSFNRSDLSETVEFEIYEKGKAIYSYLCTEAKQAYKNGFEIHFQICPDPKDPNNIEPPRISGWKKFICINKERFNPINFGIDYHAEGYDGAACFHYDGVAKLWRFSLYNDNGLVDCSTIAKQFGGGGHFSAAGMVVDTTTFLKILNNS